MFAGLLVGLKQIMPENDVTLVGYVKFRAKVGKMLLEVPLHSVLACKLLHAY